MLAALRRLGIRKTAAGLTPFVRFFSTTFGAGVNAPHCPITRPKRRIQPKRYTTWGNKIIYYNFFNIKIYG
jgi:hypothetical protein